jgi:hypothetical protein
MDSLSRLIAVVVVVLAFFAMISSVLAADYDDHKQKAKNGNLKRSTDDLIKNIKDPEDSDDESKDSDHATSGSDPLVRKHFLKTKKDMGKGDQQLLRVGQAMFGQMFPRTSQVFNQFIPELDELV